MDWLREKATTRQHRLEAEFHAEVRRGDGHGKGCACWQCIGRLQAWIIRTHLKRGMDEIVAYMLSMGS